MQRSWRGFFGPIWNRDHRVVATSRPDFRHLPPLHYFQDRKGLKFLKLEHKEICHFKKVKRVYLCFLRFSIITSNSDQTVRSNTALPPSFFRSHFLAHRHAQVIPHIFSILFFYKERFFIVIFFLSNFKFNSRNKFENTTFWKVPYKNGFLPAFFWHTSLPPSRRNKDENGHKFMLVFSGQFSLGPLILKKVSLVGTSISSKWRISLRNGSKSTKLGNTRPNTTKLCTGVTTPLAITVNVSIASYFWSEGTRYPYCWTPAYIGFIVCLSYFWVFWRVLICTIYLEVSALRSPLSRQASISNLVNRLCYSHALARIVAVQSLRFISQCQSVEQGIIASHPHFWEMFSTSLCQECNL